MKVDVIGTRGFPLIEGGVEKHCEALYPLLSREVETTVYRRKAYVKSTEFYPGITFVDLPSTKVKGFEALLHSFLATCKALRNDPDIIHYHNIGPALFSTFAKRKGIPIVMTYHSPNYEHSKWGAIASRFLKHCEKVAIRNADRIIFVNKYQMEKFHDETQRKSLYIPNGVPRPIIPKNAEYLKNYGLKRGKYILSVGRITPEKGFDTLIKAFSELEYAGDCKLVIVGGVEGESEYKRKLEKLARGLPVIFTGQIHGDELAQMYYYAGLFVLASNNEGFPITLLEAMSYGLDVLVSDIPAAHLVPLSNLDYFATGDVVALRDAIKRKLSVPQEDRRDYDVSLYDWAEIARETLSVYESVLA